MLPRELSGTYRRYKQDTNNFGTWLCNNAIVCGYEPPQDTAKFAAGSSTRIKGKARHGAKEAAEDNTPPGPQRRAIPVSEFLVQANRILGTRKPTIKVPLVMQKILSRAIERRKKCSTWFENLQSTEKSATLEASNAQHQHFIGILEEIYKLLQPRFAAAPVRKPRNPLLNEAVGNSAEEDDNEALEKALAPRKGAFSAKMTTTEDYETEEPANTDLAFVIFCFLEDLQVLQYFLKVIWQQYVSKALDLQATSLVTNVALGLIDKKEQDLVEQLPSTKSKSSFDAILDAIIPAKEGEGRVLDGDSRDLTYFWISQSFQKYRKFGTQVPHHKLPHIMPITDFHPNAPDKNQRGDRLLSLMWMDLHIKHQGELFGNKPTRRAGTAGGILCHPFFDELTSGFEHMFVPRSLLTFSAAFKARTFLNVNDLMGNDTFKAYEKLRYQAALADTALSITFVQNAEQPTMPPLPDLKPIWGTDDAAYKASCCAMTVKNVVKDNFHIRWKLSTLDDGRVWDDAVSDKSTISETRTIWPSTDPCFFFNHNPVYCGMESLRLAVLMENLGIEQSNKVYSFVSVAHMYNAFKQAGQLGGEWAAMENAMSLYKDDLFNGEYPSDEKSILTRFLLFLKFPAAFFASDSRAKTSDKPLLHPLVKDLGALIERAELSTHLEAYLKGEMSGERLLHMVWPKNKKDSANRKHEPTQIEMLIYLRDSSMAALPRLNFDLISLNKKCSKLLLAIRQACKKELGTEHEENGIDLAFFESKWNITTPIEMLYEAFGSWMSKGLRGNEDGGIKISPREPAPATSRFAVALRVLHEHLSELNSEVEVSPIDVVAEAREYMSKRFREM